MYQISLGTILKAINGSIHKPFMAEAKLPLLLGRVQFKNLTSFRCSSKVSIGNDVTIGKDVTIGHRVFIGVRTYIDEKVVISDRVSISRNVSLLTNTHRMDKGDRRAGEIYFVSPLEIGEGVWIGTDVIVLPQVKKIGAYSVVGAGSVVTKDVPDNVIVAGNPAKIIRELEPLELNSQSKLISS
jgi:acetyltransferase-like isoleucine patch superfamily enzyme